MPESLDQDQQRVIFDNILNQPHLWQVVAELLWKAAHADDATIFLNHILPAIFAQAGGDYAFVATPIAGRWTVIGEAGTGRSLPLELLAEVLDRQAAQSAGQWGVVPLYSSVGATVELSPQHKSVGNSSADVLAVHCRSAAESGKVLAVLQNLAPVLADALASVRFGQQNLKRLRRMEAILEIAGQWNKTHEVEPLLVHMAEAATRLLAADRASIFLWDRANHTLVGRPALGIPGGELRIPDDRGVVGQVIQSGEPRRVDVAIEPQAIDRRVDTQLHYQTRTLLCVPL
ncbi:MAG: GAF domain-containing protein, partial [Thermoguttaceae bacterium]